MSGPVGVQKEASRTAGANAWWFREDVDGRWQSYSISADDHCL